MSRTAEDFLQEMQGLNFTIEEKHYGATVTVKDCLDAMDKYAEYYHELKQAEFMVCPKCKEHC